MKSSFFTPWLYKHGDSLIASLAGFILICLYSHYGGIGVSPDSVAYISTARNLTDGNGFTELGGQPLVAFPVIFPLFLSIIMEISQSDILQCGPILNGLLFAAVIFLSGTIIERFQTPSRWYKTAILLLITSSPFLLEIYTMIWSETLFIFLSLIFFIALHAYFRKRTLFSLFMVGIVAGITFDTRFAGVTLVATASVLILLDLHTDFWVKIKHLLIFVGISCSLVATNLIRNAIVSEYATGPRQKGITPLSKNIEYASDIVSQWWSLEVGTQIRILFFAIVFIIFLGILFKNCKSKAHYTSFENITALFFIVYVSFIIITSTISRYEKINNRLLSPAFLPFLFGITHQVPVWIKRWDSRILKIGVASLSIGVVMFVSVGYLSTDMDNYSFMSESGIPGYTEDDWKESPTIRFLEKDSTYFDPDSVVYSNHSPAVYLYTNNAVDALPEKAYKKDVKMFMDESPIILIWFNNEPNEDLLSLKDIQKKKDIRILHSFSDGFIFEITNKHSRARVHKKKRKYLLHRHKFTKRKILIPPTSSNS